MMDNEELEEFKYEFNLKYLNLIPMCTAYFDNLIKGYIFLHQLLRDDIGYFTNEELIFELRKL